MVKLCPGLAPVNFAQAKKDYPDIAYAIEAVDSKPIATWYTDRSQYINEAIATLAACAPKNGRLDTLPVFVIYGLPNKDCKSIYSSSGSNKNSGDYALFISKLAALVGKQDVLYVLEPDAVGLIAESASSCGWENNYMQNMASAITILTQSNPSAKLYVDVGWWIFNDEEQIKSMVSIITTLAKSGSIKGIVINTSNYRSNDELLKWCKIFVDATPGYEFTCVFDTSRNYHGASPNGEWCNARTAGIGLPPTDQTGSNVVDYYLWLKTPGQSDGECNSGGVSVDAMAGPSAGEFFHKGFCMMFDNGYFVNHGGLPRTNKYALDESGSTSSVSPTVIGIIVGTFVGVALLVFGAGLLMKKQKESRRQQQKTNARQQQQRAQELQAASTKL